MRARETLIFLVALVIALVGLASPLWIGSAMPTISGLLESITETLSGILRSFGG